MSDERRAWVTITFKTLEQYVRGEQPSALWSTAPGDLEIIDVIATHDEVHLLCTSQEFDEVVDDCAPQFDPEYGETIEKPSHARYTVPTPEDV